MTMRLHLMPPGARRVHASYDDEGLYTGDRSRLSLEKALLELAQRSVDTGIPMANVHQALRNSLWTANEIDAGLAELDQLGDVVVCPELADSDEEEEETLVSLE